MTDKQLIELNKIPGNDYLKRAVEVAVYGKHTITVVGNPENGLEYLRIVFSDEQLFTFIEPCPCGNFEDNILVCNCPNNIIIEYMKSPGYQRAMGSEIIVRLLTPMFSDYSYVNIDKTAVEFLKTAYNRFHFPASTSRINKILSIAKTIAKMEDIYPGNIMTWHMAEAIQYQIPPSFTNSIIDGEKI